MKCDDCGKEMFSKYLWKLKESLCADCYWIRAVEEEVEKIKEVRYEDEA